MTGILVRAGLALVLAIIAFANGGTGAGIFFMIGAIFFFAYALSISAKGDSRSAAVPDKAAGPSNRFICQNCGKIRSGWYQKCPDCGAVGKMEKMRDPGLPKGQ